MSDSSHLLLALLDQVIIMDDDGTNKEVVLFRLLLPELTFFLSTILTRL